MPKLDLVRDVTSGDELQKKIKTGVDTIYNVALASYGANSGNVMIENRYGEPLISHDGITNVGRLIVSDPVENAAISVIRQASEKTNQIAGDSTTLTIVLAKLAYDYWSGKQSTLSPREISRRIERNVELIISSIQKHKIRTTKKLIAGVARISSGDKAIGAMVTDAVRTVGKHGGISIVEQANPVIESEVVNGFVFQKGMRSIALASDMQSITSRHDNPHVVVMSKLVSKNDDILPILDKLLVAGMNNIVLIADVSGQALETIIANKRQGRIDISIVEPTAVNRDLFLEDLAFYCGTKVFNDSPDNFDIDEFVGRTELAYITVSETVLVGGKVSDEQLLRYIQGIDDPKRVEQLTGSTVKISVGAPTQAERQELKLRIDDAVCATKTALTNGVVPGGGVMLRDIAKHYHAENKEFEADYITKSFEILADVDNDDLDNYAVGCGVDISDHSGKAVKMVDANIVDSALAIEQAVINAHSAAAQLLSVRTALTFTKDME